MKRILFIAAIFIAITTNAQTRFGVQVGAIASSVKIKIDEEDNIKNKFTPGFTVGVFAEMPLSENLFINPALNFVHKGGKTTADYDDEFGSGHVEYTLKLNYLELPLNLMYKLNGADASGLYFGAGPVISWGFGGEAKYTDKGIEDDMPFDESSKTSVKFDGKKNAEDDNLHLKAIEVGANAFVGYELGNGLSIQAQYRPSFTNLSPYDDESYKNTYFGFSLRYRF